MAFNYAKLLGRLRERGYTQKSLAQAIGINKATMSEKLNNKYSFTMTEMGAICNVLGIPRREIGDYFFDEKVQEN